MRQLVAHLSRVACLTFSFHELRLRQMPTRIRLRQMPTRILAYQHSFIPSSVKLWNQLPQEVVIAPSIGVLRAMQPTTHLA